MLTQHFHVPSSRIEMVVLNDSSDRKASKLLGFLDGLLCFWSDLKVSQHCQANSILELITL